MGLRHLNDATSLFCDLTHVVLFSLFLLTFIELPVSILFDNMFLCILIQFTNYNVSGLMLLNFI